MAAARSEIGNPQVRIFAQPLHLGPDFRLSPCIEYVERKRPEVAHRGPRAKLVDDGERWDLPHRGFHPRSVEMKLQLTVLLTQLVFRQAEVGQPGEKLGLEDLLAAIERVTGEPDHLFVGET